LKLKYLIYLIIVLFSVENADAQKILLNGYLKSQTSGEPAMFANCYETATKTFTVSNETGFFSLKLNAGKNTVIIAHSGYLSDTLHLFLRKDTTIVHLMHELSLDEIVVRPKESSFVEQNMSGKISLSPVMIRKLPTFAGETDIIKAITFLPGVSGSNRGFSNLYVRGGGRQNNLILFDDASVYNSNHVFGLLSVFNTDVVSQIDFYKSDFPARYGGVTSSVLDLYTKDGNQTKYKATLQLGVLFSKLFVEGPIVKNKTSFLFAARGSYINIFLWPLRKMYKEGAQYISAPDYRFFDINAKITHTFANSRKLYVSFFTGNDRFDVYDRAEDSGGKYNSIVKNRFRNSSVSFGYKANIYKNLFTSTALVYSKYSNLVSMFDDIASQTETFQRNEKTMTSVENISLKNNYEFTFLKNHFLRFGIKLTTHFVQPGIYSLSRTDSVSVADTVTGNFKKLTAFENIIFFEDEYRLSKRFTVYAGVRGVQYINKTTQFVVEPRVSIRFKIAESLSVKAGYTEMSQWIHVLVNNSQRNGGEMWLPTEKKLPSEKSTQYNFGIFSDFQSLNLDFSLETYYKTQSNLLYYNFNESAFQLYTDYDDKIFKNGTGESYGIEFSARKQSEKFQMMLAYTLSWNWVLFRELNFGNRFHSNQDSRHDLNLIFQLDINRKNAVAANFTLASGAPITLPVGYSASNQFLPHYNVYSGINNRTLPLFHRLDLSYTRTFEKKGRKREFHVNLYNAYARQNPVYIYYLNNKAYKVATSSIIPSISYVWYL